MPRGSETTSAFTSGELAPSASGRMDLEKYVNGATCLRNLTIAPLGGAKRRPGTRFVCETRYSQFPSRLVKFEPNEFTAVMIEAGCQYLRFFRNNAPLGGNPELLVNGTFDSNLNGWTQSVVGAGSITWNAGLAHLEVTQALAFVSLRQDVTVTAGREYIVTYRIGYPPGTGPAFSGGSGGGSGGIGANAQGVGLTVFIGSTSGGNELYNGGGQPGLYVQRVTSPTTTLSLFFQLDVRGFSAVDEVSVRLAGPLEVTTPYTPGQLTSIGHVQSADEQYWLHACNPTNKLQRFGDTCWKFVEVTFKPPPSVEYGARPATEVQAGALSGNGVTFTAFNGPTFLASDVGREIQIVSGANAGSRAGIKSVTNSLTVAANICIPFINLNVNCNGTWKISDSPLTGCKPAAKSPVGASTTLTLDAAGWRGVTFTTDTDCGKFARVNGGTYELTCITSTTVARATIRGEASAVTKAESGAWSLEEALWSTRRGYASAGDFKDDRLYLNAGFRLSGSVVNDYENHGGGVLDDSAVLFAINSKTLATIRHILAGRQLQLFTVGGEYAVTADAVITPTDIKISAETRVGSSNVAPVQANDATLFLSRFGRHLHEFVIPKDQVSEAFAAPDLLLLAEHLTATHGLVALDFQREPTPTIWAVRADGVLLSCAYRRDENVVGWTSHDTCGTFESVAVMPHPDGDREAVWVIVNRTLGGTTRRMVEFLDDSTLIYDRRLTDSSVVYTGISCSILQGVSHLNGQRVQVQADGRYVGDCVVASGLVGLATPATDIEVGLPFVSEITMLPVKVMPDRRRVFGAVVWTQDSCNVQVRSPQGQWSCLPAGTLVGPGVREHSITGLTSDFHRTTLQLRQDGPLPFHVLSVTRLLDVGNA